MRLRKRLLVLKKFQVWFLARFFVYTTAVLLLSTVGVYFWFKVVADSVFKLAALLKDSFVGLVALNAKMGVVVFAVLFVGLLGLALLEAFIFSRKIAGPLFAFLRHLEKCQSRGRWERFTLRKGDLLVELQETFNRTVDTVNARQEAKSLRTSILLPFSSNSQKRKSNAKTRAA